MDQTKLGAQRTGGDSRAGRPSSRATGQVNTGMLLELDIAHGAISAGETAMAEISGANDFYTAPLLLYSYGFERLLKVALYLRQWVVAGSRPPGTRIKAFGHDLRQLHETLLLECEAGPQPFPNLLAKRLVEEDRAWFKRDPLGLKFVEVMTAFATEGRYHHLNQVLGIESRGKDAMDLMTELENLVAEQHGIGLPEDASASLDPYFEAVSHQIIALARRIYRATSRLFAYGFMGPLGKQLSSSHMLALAKIKDNEIAGPDTRQS